MDVATGDIELFAIVLAAGRGRRFGSTKQLARIDGRPMVERACSVAVSVCQERSILVVGHDWRRVHAACAPLAGFLVVNERYSDGLATSLRAGLDNLPAQAAGALILLADQPLVDSSTVRRVVDAWRERPGCIAVSVSRDRTSPPLVLPASLFAEARRLEGDRGARDIVHRHRADAIELALDEAAVDIDTREDLAALDEDSRPAT